MAASTSIPEAVDAHLLEQAQAERDRALHLLDRLEHAFPAGFSTQPVQALLREARALLVETGTRKSDAPPVWNNRR